MIRLCVFSLCAAVLVCAAPARAQAPADLEGVRRAALDYLDGFYDGDSAKIRRSVRPDVVKYGFYVENGQQDYAGEAMTFQEMIEYADRRKASGRRTPETAPKEVVPLDVQDQTAAVKVVASWGTDYLQLAKFDGRWMIMHVLWQSPPPKR